MVMKKQKHMKEKEKGTLFYELHRPKLLLLLLLFLTFTFDFSKIVKLFKIIFWLKINV